MAGSSCFIFACWCFRLMWFRKLFNSILYVRQSRSSCFRSKTPTAQPVFCIKPIHSRKRFITRSNVSALSTSAQVVELALCRTQKAVGSAPVFTNALNSSSGFCCAFMHTAPISIISFILFWPAYPSRLLQGRYDVFCISFKFFLIQQTVPLLYVSKTFHRPGLTSCSSCFQSFVSILF